MLDTSRLERYADCRRCYHIPGDKEADDERAAPSGRHVDDYISTYIEEWERKMRSISREQDRLDGGVELLMMGTRETGRQGSSWLNVPDRVSARLLIAPGQRPGSSRRAPSLSSSILARKL